MTKLTAPLTFRLTKEEKEMRVKHCELEARTQNDVFREYLRSIKRKLSKKIKEMDN